MLLVMLTERAAWGSGMHQQEDSHDRPVSASEPVQVPRAAMVIAEYEIFCEAVAALVERVPGFEVVALAQTPEDAIRRAGALHPDIAIVGPPLTAREGFTDGGRTKLIRAIKDASPSTRIVLLTYQERLEEVQGAIDAGAEGIVEAGGPLEQFSE
ncbi:MAG: response regulator [Actinobacteria bacterium]|uniref:Unannotated protein n=1 Tax=freshwater metagenome TaxID=449393 RepID=A0A6J7E822_9ZZZZ|nr:response regulator [Actinomycetota bacterium]